MSNIVRKTILARLLAQENISVEQGNFETAWFEPKSRRLGLPVWPEISNDLYDLLVGHEVSHALHTPADGWHQADVTLPGCPRSFLNVTEDVRIEKLILRRFPGLIANFKRGYKELLAKDFFGIAEKEISDLYFMDRLNIKAKCRDLIDVPFTDEEMVYVNLVYAAETWDETVAATRAIYEWLKERNDDVLNKEAASENKLDLGDMDFSSMPGSGDGDADETEATATVEKSSAEEADDAEADGNSEEVGDTGAEDESDDGEGEDTSTDNGADGTFKGDDFNPDLEKVSTDEHFREMEKGLSDSLANGGNVMYVKAFPEAVLKDVIVPAAEVIAARPAPAAKNDGLYKKWLVEQKAAVGTMVKEFEMRKSAYRTLRARTSTRGIIDVNKLHSYKFSDQIFKTYATLADAKNHGMVMLVDYSGSMYEVIEKVIEQILVLSMFCKQTGIPFVVYGFSSTLSEQRRENIRRAIDPKVPTISWAATSIFELLSSSMTKSLYEKGFRGLFEQTLNKRMGASRYEILSTTPLNNSLIAMKKIIRDFRTKNRVQKMNFVTLTDGESDSMRLSEDFYNLPGRGQYVSNRKTKVELDGKYIDVTLHSAYRNREFTEKLLQSIRDDDVTIVNYFFGSSRNLLKVFGQKYRNPELYEKTRSELRKSGFAVFDNNGGYDRRFLVKSDNSVFDYDDDLDFDAGATAKKIAKEFSKHSNSKKNSRLIATKFAELVA